MNLEKISAASATAFGTGVLFSSVAIRNAKPEKMNYIPLVIGGALTVVGGVGMAVSNYLNRRNNQKENYDNKMIELLEEYE